MALGIRAQEILRSLERLYSEHRLHHAYIFSGPEGAGKRETANAFAAFLFGGVEQREQLAARIERSGHPDLLRVEPEDGVLKVEQVRELPRFLSFAPLEAARRVVLIEDAHLMNAQAANALLKALEEPPVHSMFVLSCPDASLLLSTIRSRCQILRFFPLSGAELLQHLKERLPSFSEEEYRDAAAWSGGSVARAMRYLEDEALRSRVEAARESLILLWENTPRIPSRSLEITASMESREEAADLLDTWYSLARDFCYLLGGTPAGEDTLFHPSSRQRLLSLAGRYAGWGENKLSLQAIRDELARKTEAVHRVRVAYGFNVGVRATLDDLLGRMQLFSIGKIRQGL